MQRCSIPQFSDIPCITIGNGKILRIWFIRFFKLRYYAIYFIISCNIFFEYRIERIVSGINIQYGVCPVSSCYTYTIKYAILFGTSMLELKPVILKEVDKKLSAYYTLTWTALTRADKYRITTAVPAVAGLYELYYMDTSKRLNLLAVTHAWYGGLRSNLRQAVDPYHTHDLSVRALLEEAPLFYRYSCSDSFGDLLDVVWFLHTGYFPHDVRVDHSQRYKKIFLTEQAPDKIYWLDD